MPDSQENTEMRTILILIGTAAVVWPLRLLLPKRVRAHTRVRKHEKSRLCPTITLPRCEPVFRFRRPLSIRW
jgi:hypothetical protein